MGITLLFVPPCPPLQVNRVFPDHIFLLLMLADLFLLHENTFLSFLSNRNGIIYSLEVIVYLCQENEWLQKRSGRKLRQY